MKSIRSIVILLVVLVCIICVLSRCIYLNEYLNLEYIFINASFDSDVENPSVKNIKYKIFINNNGSEDAYFKVIFKRPKAEWYTFLSSIPVEYTTEPLKLKAKEVKFYELETSYQSKEEKVTEGFLNDFTIKFKKINGY